MSRAGEADRVRRCREVFAHAVACGMSMEAARRDLTRLRWADADARLAAKRSGTHAPAEPAKPAPVDAPWMLRD